MAEELEIGLEPEIAAPAADEEVVPITTLSHTIEEVPELSGKAIGDVVSFTVRNVSEDGKSYDLEFVEAAAPELPPEAGISGAPVGREAVLGSFVE